MGIGGKRARAQGMSKGKQFVTVIIPRMVIRVPVLRISTDTPERLTPAQLRVFDQLVTGKTSKEISASLNCTTRAVAFHLGQIYRKAGVSGRGELLAAYGRRAK